MPLSQPLYALSVCSRELISIHCLHVVLLTEEAATSDFFYGVQKVGIPVDHTIETLGHLRCVGATQVFIDKICV